MSNALSALPATLTALLAEQSGWRFSLGIWSLTSSAALVPWLLIIARERRA